jgi:hypothetical protein
MLAAAGPTAGVWLTRHGPRIELWLPWPCVRHTSATKTSAIDYHAVHSCTMTAQLTRASAGSWIVIPPGGAALAPELADATADEQVHSRLWVCGRVACIHVSSICVIH